MSSINTSSSMKSPANTTGDIWTPRATTAVVKHNHSDPLHLVGLNSDDSSVFSGLDGKERVKGNDENKSIRSVRFDHEELQGGKMLAKNGGESCSAQDEVLSIKSQNIPPGEASVGRGYNCNALRNLVDHGSAFGDSQCDDCESEMSRSLPSRYSVNQEFLYEQDASTISYGSVYEFQRPRGKMTLLTNLALDTDTDHESSEHEHVDVMNRETPGSPPTPDGASSLKRILKEFENEMDASISGMKDDDDGPLNIVALSSWQDEIHKGSSMDDDFQVLSDKQAKQMQQVLHLACREVETLKENNEQFLSEIEQTEEEHVSDMKLYDQQMKKKLSDMKVMYQEELEALVQEKDAAIAEAGRQAARYAESGRKQIESLKKQIAKLRANAEDAAKKNSNDPTDKNSPRHDDKMMATLGALQKSYESQLEKIRAEADTRTRTAVDEAVAKATQMMLADRDREVHAAVRALRSQLESQKLSAIQTANDTAKLKIHAQKLTHEQEATTKALRSILSKVETRYAKELHMLTDKHKNCVNTMGHGQVGSDNEFETETLLKKVIEAFAFLLENTESRAHAAEEQARLERTRKANSEVYQQARLDLITKHRKELDFSRNQVEKLKDKVERLEQSLKISTMEKRALQEKLRKEIDSHRKDVRSLNLHIDNMEDPVLLDATDQAGQHVSTFNLQVADSSTTISGSDSTKKTRAYPGRGDSQGYQKDHESTFKFPMHKVRLYPSFPPPPPQTSNMSETRDDDTLENIMSQELREGLGNIQVPVPATQEDSPPKEESCITKCTHQAVTTQESSLVQPGNDHQVRSHDGKTAASNPPSRPQSPINTILSCDSLEMTPCRSSEDSPTHPINDITQSIEESREVALNTNNCPKDPSCSQLNNNAKRRSFAILRSFRSSKSKNSKPRTLEGSPTEQRRRGRTMAAV